MIDFRLSENDQEKIDAIRQESLICRKYARYYDEHEQDEIPPDELPEAADLPPSPNSVSPGRADWVTRP
jgi:acyl-CoA dehydrogenase